MDSWNLAEAKNKLSAVVNLALHRGPQMIVRRKERVVLMSEAMYQKLSLPQESFIDFLFQGPNLEGVDLTRDKSPMRKVSL